MRIVVIGSTGPVGSGVVTALRAAGHDAFAASLESCAKALTGERPAETLRGVEVVVDAAEPPCFDTAAGDACWTASMRSLLAQELEAGVQHHVVLSAVGAKELVRGDYFRARCLQERLLHSSPLRYSIVRTTLIFEHLRRLAEISAIGAAVHVPPVLVQPVAAEDVVRLIAAVAVDKPLHGMVEIGGPEPLYLDGLVQRFLGASQDPRTVIADPHAHYFGAHPGERSLIAGDEAEIGEVRFDDWLREHALASSTVDPNDRVSSERPLRTYEFRVSDVPPGSVMLLGDVAVFNAGGGFCATQARCTHRSGPLSEGSVDDTTVTCPLHGAQFNIWTGAVLRGPASKPLATYPVTIDGGIGRVGVD